MADTADALATLARLGRDPMSGVYTQPGADEGVIRQMQASALKDLGEPVPGGYVALLRVTNGVQINGEYFKPAEHLVPENLVVPRTEIIVLGNEGNTAEFVFDRHDRRFHAINMGFPDERFASFDEFAEMLASVLREQQVHWDGRCRPHGKARSAQAVPKGNRRGTTSAVRSEVAPDRSGVRIVAAHSRPCPTGVLLSRRRAILHLVAGASRPVTPRRVRRRPCQL